MNRKELLKPLKNKINANELVEISRYSIDDCSMLVSFASVSEKLSLVYQTGEFCIDGYRVLRNSDISEISTSDKNDNLRFVNMIYAKENHFPEKSDIKLDSWTSVFEFLLSVNKTVMIECSYEDAIDYYFGKVIYVNGNIVHMKCFDGAGILFKDIVKINTNFVSSVTFDDRYTSVMSKYINW